MLAIIVDMGDHFQFGSVFIKKQVTKPKFKKKNQNRTEIGSNRPVSVQFGSVRFGFFGQKPVQTGLAWFFSGLARFFSVLVRFGSVFSISEL
jgi:hypothetical protein